ncbi:MAG: DnaJ domain-containing protein [Bosea sp.]|jgi:hypothetical protein|nr:DnaJ domain-containing protein [Bosea sp. (in: a-proteobacteria)]
MALLYGLATLIAVWWGAKLFVGSNPARLAGLMKKLGGAAAMGVAALLMMRGRIDLAMLVAGFGAWLLGWAYSHPLAQWTRSWKTSQGQRSTVASRTLSMELDHDSGAMRGTVLAGSFTGRELDSLSPAELSALMAEVEQADPDAARLLEAYLDRRFPRGRADAQPDGDARASSAHRSGAMTKQEAYDILGLQPGADEEAIRQAHRNLMKRLHPDAGGSSALAARVNQAKDVLLT